MRRIVTVGALLMMGCPGGGTGSSKGQVPIPPVIEGSFDLPTIPAKIETTASQPMDGDTPSARSPLLDVMLGETKREMDALSKQPDPAYYLAYQIVERRTVNLETEGGALIADRDATARSLDVEVRVGSPALDNTRRLQDDQSGVNGPLFRTSIVPFGDDKVAISNALWVETDRRYREALLGLSYVRQDLRTLKTKETAPDFSHAKTETYVGAPATLTFDKAQWIERLKRCSAKALKGSATRGSCEVTFTLNTVWFTNSEGTAIQQSWTQAELAVSVGVKSDDGQNLNRLEQRFGRSPADLPSDAEIDEVIAEVNADLDALHAAPRAEPYVGPAILEGRASGVFFHEVFGHRIEGHRQKDSTEGQTFGSYIGKLIGPEWLSVYDDPTLLTLNGLQLNGFYRFDDEGVRAQRVDLIKDGQLVGFNTNRNPFKGFETSNGHGRRQPGMSSVARQGNLVVEAAKSVPREDLQKMLLEEIKKQNRPYGMVFTDISGGYTLTSSFTPQAFKVHPVMAYRIYPDGKRELVRGVDIVGTPLLALQSIRAASREIETFNGVCGAESGYVPVSASAPSLLVERLETDRGFVPDDRPPVLGPPSVSKESP